MKTKSEIKIDCAYDKLVPAKSLKPNLENPNLHTQAQVRLTAEIIRRTRWRYPITVSNQSGLIVDGHCRHAAALLIDPNMKVPVDYQDFDSYEDEKAEMVRKNKLEELSEFSDSKLADILNDLEASNYDLSLTAVSQDEIDGITNQDEMFEYYETELKPYNKTHILLSFNPAVFPKIESALKTIINDPEIEYEQASN